MLNNNKRKETEKRRKGPNELTMYDVGSHRIYLILIANVPASKQREHIKRFRNTFGAAK